MGLRERMVELTTPEEADQFIEQNPLAAIFKAGTCHKTMQGWGHVQKFLEPREDIPVGIIRVVENRAASNRVAERSGIVHHSPQIILFKGGQPIYELNNWDITPENLEPAKALLPEPGEAVQADGASHSSLDTYKRILDLYLEGHLSEYEFQLAYLNTFRGDASLRSQEEFELINSLFGNPDQGIAATSASAGNLGHHIHPLTIMQHEARNPQATPLRERAAALREKLNGF
jgi:bacillithiol system protein YtxJ